MLFVVHLRTSKTSPLFPINQIDLLELLYRLFGIITDLLIVFNYFLGKNTEDIVFKNI